MRERTNDYNVFVIEPVITVLDKQSTSGLMRNTTLVKGELTLVAKNRIDGSMYHSAVVSVSGQAAEGADPYKAMISALLQPIRFTPVLSVLPGRRYRIIMLLIAPLFFRKHKAFTI